MPAALSEAKPARRPANKSTVVRGLLSELLHGKRQTADRLTEAEACERFRVSRTPVREAFFELEALGLIELRRNCGAIVLPLGPKELGDIYSVRSLLEVEAARLAAQRSPIPNLDALSLAFRQVRDSGVIDSEWRQDRELHFSIAKASGNARLASEIGRYANLVQAMREIVGERVFGIHKTSAEEHLSILDALRQGDPDSASQAMHLHLRQASESAVAAMTDLRANPG